MKKQPESNNPKKPGKPKLPKEIIEQDPDDLVHKQPIEPDPTGEEDPDDMMHQPGTGPVVDEDTMEDPDDLVHGYPEEERTIVTSKAV